MSVQEFSNTLQSQVYKNWLKTLDKNIINTSAKVLRDREQTSQKTSFYITKDKIKEMYKTITGQNLDDLEVQLFMRELLSPITEGSSKPIIGERIKVNGVDAVFFQNIGFQTISVRLSNLFNSYPAIEDAYKMAEDSYYEEELKTLRSSAKYKTLTTKQKQEAERDVGKKAKERGTLGYYYNKGHVISVATNLVKQFRQDIEKADQLAERQRKVLIEVLDKYIAKLQQDDLNTANLPNAATQELYAKYTKSSDVYLVEMQHRVGNIESGSASVAIIDELRNLFNLSNTDFRNVIEKSPTLGVALAETEGSPSFVNLLAKDLVDILQTGKKVPKQYKTEFVLVAKKELKLSKKSNKKEIAAAKSLKNKIKSVRSDTKKFKEDILVKDTTLNLLTLLNAGLHDQIRRNMGTGSSTNVLNYRSGRFAQSVKVEKISESRQGMITAFYSYMKNPYATFSEGGRQQLPRSRDPKLLISKSIREIASSLVGNRLRAVNV